MKMNFALPSVFAGVFLLSCCATKQLNYHVNVDSISGSDIHKKSYILLPGNKDTKSNDLQYEEYATYVYRALKKQGFVTAKSFEDANVAIFLLYGIGDPQQIQFSYPVAVWGQTGTVGSATRNRPTYGLKEIRPAIGTRITYSRFMVLDAFEIDEYNRTKNDVQLWKTIVTSSGSSKDLREVFPALVAASQPYIATNTGKMVKVVLPENDKRIIEIKGLNKNELKDKSVLIITLIGHQKRHASIFFAFAAVNVSR